MIDADPLFRVFRGLFAFLRQELDAQYDKNRADVKENAHSENAEFIHSNRYV